MQPSPDRASYKIGFRRARTMSCSTAQLYFGQRRNQHSELRLPSGGFDGLLVSIVTISRSLEARHLRSTPRNRDAGLSVSSLGSPALSSAAVARRLPM